MADNHKTSLRIDWFDGTVIEESTSNLVPTGFEDEESDASVAKPQYTEKKLMGFKRLLDLSQQDAPNLTLQLSGRSSFWDLLNSELKDDFIVLICKVIAKLYTSLQFGQKSLMLTKLLNTRFLTSKFLDKLTDYAIGLPKVRIVEKRMNMQFWDDVEAFYRNVLAVCEGICTISPEKTGESVVNILEAVRISVMGVMEEHKEQFSEDLFLMMDRLEDKIGKAVLKAPINTQTPIHPLTSELDKNNFRNLNIFPDREDLLGTVPCEIEPNIVNGAYASVEHYLDIQFKLLREDCFGPLREGISKYMENPTKRRHENIRVHPKVRIIRTYVSNHKMGYLVDIAWEKRSIQVPADCQKYASNKQLMFGSLLLFTSDSFETVLCGTVLDSSANLLREGHLAVTFHSPVSSRVFSEAFLMVESEVFFEPYHRVLKVLQAVDDVPMRRYIVDVQPETRPPSYLTHETIYTLPQEAEEISFPALDLNQWPSAEDFGLDQPQMEAFKLALTREFAVIQGPPGTGKTFIGVKVATTILQNLSLEGTPMLAICYTNHALDQFLEGVLKVTDNVIRLGSQSKNPKIEPFTLNNLRTKSKSRYSYLYSTKRQEQEKLFQQMIDVQSDIEKCESEILTYDTLKSYLTFDLRPSKEDPILKWLFDSAETIEDVEILSNNDDLDDWEKQLEEENEEKRKLESCFSEQWALKEMDSMSNSIKYVKDVTQDHMEGSKMADKFQEQIGKVQKRLREFKNRTRVHRTTGSVKRVTPVKDPYALSPEERWILYFEAVSAIKVKLMGSMNELQAKHHLCTQEQEEIATLLDAEVIKTARVVGVTTTTAARRHDLLQTLRSPIVIIEEAAEVLEAHIVASLTHHCQHVVLIGDHKQLRPTTAHHRLAKTFKLEVSLFERMIRNGVHARTLTMQRRMRPEFVELLVPTVYERLDCHPCVLKHDDVRGVAGNLFFVNHGSFEDDMSEEGHSHRNSLEARWCIELANYLRHKNYRAEDIVILATYAGQAALIKELSKSHQKLDNVKVTVVDNYQGEESRIVILSLVRSNSDGKIGFLSAPNRICVALSRAKEGFYIMGNMTVLKSASPVWNAINRKLESQNAIGNSLTLRCDIHTENTLKIDDAAAFKNCLSGTCLAICHTQRKDSSQQ